MSYELTTYHEIEDFIMDIKLIKCNECEIKTYHQRKYNSEGDYYTCLRCECRK